MFNPEQTPLDKKEITGENPEIMEQKLSPEQLLELELGTEFESGLTEDFEAAQKVMDEFERIAQSAETPEQKEKLNSLREKIAKATKKFFKLGRNLALVGMIAMGVHYVDYYRTHPDVEIKDDGKGNIEYVHPDAKTSHILNVLAGKDSISFEEALENARGIFRTRAEILGIKLPTDFDTYNIDQMDNFFVAALNEKNEEGDTAKPGELKDYFYEYQYLKRMDVPEDRVKEIYNLVWEVEKECGNPKIRFQTKGPNVFGVALSDEDTYRPHYYPSENTLYLPMDMFVEQTEGYQNLLAEMSHAKQLKDNPVGFYFKTASSSLRIFSKGGFDMEKLYEAQLEEYKISGSIEHEAHSVIEPRLAEKYEGLTKIKGIKGEKEELK